MQVPESRPQRMGGPRQHMQMVPPNVQSDYSIYLDEGEVAAGDLLVRSPAMDVRVWSPSGRRMFADVTAPLLYCLLFGGSAIGSGNRMFVVANVNVNEDIVTDLTVLHDVVQLSAIFPVFFTICSFVCTV